MSTLTYTKAIRNGKLKATEMNVGESVAGTLIDFKENQYGTNNVLLLVNGREVEIMVAGNLKFLAQDVADGKKNLDTFTIITRVEDKEYKGRKITQYRVGQKKETTATTATASTTTATTTAAAPVAKPSVKQQLDEIRAKRGANGTNA